MTVQLADAPHPGYVLADYVRDRDISQRELARRLGVTPKHVSYVVRGKATISASMALALERVLGRPALFWLRLQALHDLAKARTKIAARSIAMNGNRAARPARQRYRDRVRGA